jgi:hypothetical protein
MARFRKHIVRDWCQSMVSTGFSQLCHPTSKSAAILGAYGIGVPQLSFDVNVLAALAQSNVPSGSRYLSMVS